MSEEIKICLTCGRYEFSAGRAAVREMEKAISFDCEEASLYALPHTSETLCVFSLIFPHFFYTNRYQYCGVNTYFEHVVVCSINLHVAYDNTWHKHAKIKMIFFVCLFQFSLILYSSCLTLSCYFMSSVLEDMNRN